PHASPAPVVTRSRAAPARASNRCPSPRAWPYQRQRRIRGRNPKEWPPQRQHPIRGRNPQEWLPPATAMSLISRRPTPPVAPHTKPAAKSEREAEALHQRAGHAGAGRLAAEVGVRVQDQLALAGQADEVLAEHAVGALVEPHHVER